MVSQGNTVVAEATITGTHKGEYLGIPATGKSIELPFVHIYYL
jgi:predicted ester cyclase